MLGTSDNGGFWIPDDEVRLVAAAEFALTNNCLLALSICDHCKGVTLGCF